MSWGGCFVLLNFARWLNMAGAMDALPDLPLNDSPKQDRQCATGTDARSLHLCLHQKQLMAIHNGHLLTKTTTRVVFSIQL